MPRKSQVASFAVITALMLSVWTLSSLPASASPGQPPLVGDVSMELQENSGTTQIALPALDPGGSIVSRSIVTPPQHGTIPDVVSGEYVDYTPNVNYSGPDSMVFQATNNEGLSATGNISIQVDPVDQPPVYVVTFSLSQTSGTAPLAVNVANTTAPIAGAAIIGYDWDFGDGTHASTSSASHVYSTSGTFHVKLTLTDALQRTASSQQTVRVVMPTCNGKPATIVVTSPGQTTYGTNGDDVIVGTSGDDVINGLGGNDTICSGPGDDFIQGGAGNDYIDAGAGNNTVYGDDGNDVIIAGNGDNTMYGGSGNDSITVGNGNNKLFGNGGNDWLWAGAGFNTLQGDDGNDRLRVHSTTGNLWGDAGFDVMQNASHTWAG